MPSPSKTTTPVPKAAEPRYGPSFDPWNSSSTGHQRAENRLGSSTGWRASRNRKLTQQFRAGAGGGARVPDSVGAGSADWDAAAAGARARCSVLDMLARPGTMQKATGAAGAAAEEEEEEGKASPRKEKQQRRLFDGVVVYVNGSTYPAISDHRLKHVLAAHGGCLSTHLGRRRVTHVILGQPGAGGGLAAGKLQREIRAKAPAVRFVAVEWVLESLKAGRRLPEAGFAPRGVAIAAKGQRSVYGLYAEKKNPPPQQ
ncbi:BRCA1 C terminus domain-containing protein [Xylariomycetidae sp. FL0641]|nr:BRCA1 C terminus domain-containing protein [Xylariomycetidae sp. FL0641]